MAKVPGKSSMAMKPTPPHSHLAQRCALICGSGSTGTRPCLVPSAARTGRGRGRGFGIASRVSAGATGRSTRTRRRCSPQRGSGAMLRTPTAGPDGPSSAAPLDESCCGWSRSNRLRRRRPHGTARATDRVARSDALQRHRQTLSLSSGGEGGAGDGIRTRDILLGKQTLCQLSYSRAGDRDCSERWRVRQHALGPSESTRHAAHHGRLGRGRHSRVRRGRGSDRRVAAGQPLANEIARYQLR
jgi:hypothetical protein